MNLVNYWMRLCYKCGPQIYRTVMCSFAPHLIPQISYFLSVGMNFKAKTKKGIITLIYVLWHEPDMTSRKGNSHLFNLTFFTPGQALEKGHQEAVRNLSPDAPWQQKLLIKHRRLIAVMIPAVLYHFCWWGIFIQHDLWHLFKEKYFMTLTMIFGSLVAGMPFFSRLYFFLVKK